MTEHVAFQDALVNMQASYKDALRAFTAWFEREWQHDGREQWERSYREPYPGDEYRDAYNAGVRSVQMALDVFLDELF